MHLLQLAGGQTWPNLLPILALRPDTVTFLTSSDPKQDYRRSIESIKDACYKAGISFTQETISTQAKDPTCDECREALRNIKPDCINLTGGTKTMSIAAYDLAQSAKLPAFYLDTRRKKTPVEAVNEFSIEIRDQLNLAFPAVVSKITVPIALKANGFPVPENFKKPQEHWSRFAVQAAKIRQNPVADQEIAKAIGQLRYQFMGNESNMPKKGALRSILQIPITAGIGTPWHQYLLAASEAGVVQSAETTSPSHQEFFLIHEDPVTTQADRLRSSASETFQLLEGTWFELALLAYLQQKLSFSDIRWSVEADHHQDPSASSRGETDLVAFNTSGLSLHFISCKTSGPHGGALDHIQGLRGRATREGGKFSKAELWIFRPKTDQHRSELQSHCDAQDVILRVFTENQDLPTER
jgi:hypothetical protein